MRLHFCGDDTVSASHQSPVFCDFSVLPLCCLQNTQALVACVFCFVYCLHCSWFQRTVGSLLLSMRMTNHIHSWFIVTCWSVFSQLPLCFPGVNNKAGLGSVWDRFMPIDRAVTCQVHCYSFVDHANMFLLGVDRLSAWPILSILPIIDIGHFQNRFADNFFFIMQTNILFTGDIIYWWINNTGEII